MFKAFFSKNRGSAGSGGSWPQAPIVASLSRIFETVESIGEDDGFVLFGVSDRGVNFVVALITAAKNEVVEIGFLARFVGFSITHPQVEQVNRNLHISVAGLEEDGDLYLLAGVEAAGTFNEDTFAMILEAWRRDVMIVLHVLSGSSSLAAAFPVTRVEAALKFAANAAPSGGDGSQPDLLKAYLGGKTAKKFCGECGGRGRRGLIARTCECCEGTGFVSSRR